MKSEYKTKARERIIEYLQTNPEKRFTAKEVYDDLKEVVIGVNRTTVYRNLDRLCENGVLLRFKEPNQDAWYYQYSGDHEHCDRHIHAQCSECGKIFHLENEFVDEFEEKLHEMYGLDIDSMKTMIVGKCEECSEHKDEDHMKKDVRSNDHEHSHDHDHNHDHNHQYE